ncbi:MAG TPA: hypothetical protein VII41_17955 [Steroidobacteraceae bacterium]
MRYFLAAACLAALASSVHAAGIADEVAQRAAYVDPAGTIRWRDNRQEVALYGANYCIMSGSDYRMAGLVAGERKRMIDEDMAQFARMGWTALRLCSWGDWENADPAGNLIVNEHVDLLDYLIARARERGIYILLTPIHTYDPRFADQVNQPSPANGFSKYFQRPEMGVNPQSIAAQRNYIGQLLNHVNPYTGVALKDEPAILFIEMINEPVHHPQDLRGSVAYIDGLVKAVRDTGSRQITFFNVSQDFKIGEAIRQSSVDGVSFGWYPSGLSAGHQLRGNFLQTVDAYPDMLRPELASKPRIVYEFDQPDLLTGYMYPAMARTFRAVGAQFATMFAYDMLQTAPYNLGWQTHFLNLVHTPKKAVSAVIAAEAMRRLPRMKSYGRYPEDLSFGDFRLSYDTDSSELVASDAYMNAGSTTSAPRNPKKLQRVVGFGSSPVVGYEGSGAYFLDKVRDGVWRLELYPDEILVHDPFEQPRPDKIVSRLLARSWPMQIHLPDLGDAFYATPLTLWQDINSVARRANHAQVSVEPGVWLLSAAERVDRASLPARINRVGFDEYHVNAPRSYPDDIQSLTPKEVPAGREFEVRVRIADDTLPDAVSLWLRPAGSRSFGSAIAMSRAQGNDYVAALEAGRLAPGLYEYAVSAVSGERTVTFPGAVAQHPGEWPFLSSSYWMLRVTPPGAALRLLNPDEDYQQLSFVRPAEQYRDAFFKITAGQDGGESALRLELPDLGADTPAQYAASLYIGDRIATRSRDASRADTLHVKLIASGGDRKSVDVTLIEKDGSSWRMTALASGVWSEVSMPLTQLKHDRSIFIPSPYPGLWNYWRLGPRSRGGAGDQVRIDDVERLQLSVGSNAGDNAADSGLGVAVQSIWLTYGR